MSMVEAVPPEIIVKITSALPLNSIINCVHVCKLWRALIPNPFLAKSNPSYFVLYNESSGRFAILDSHDLDSDDRIILMKPHFSKITILGYCKGLICLKELEGARNRQIHVYNPLIGESVTVPEPSFTYSPDVVVVVDDYAFGFCGHHYKVLRWVLNIDKANANANANTEVEVYTLGSKAWRRIADVGRHVWNVQGRPVCVGGIVHWLISEPSILTFDLAAEEFGLYPLPLPLHGNGNGNDKKIIKLGEMDDCLIATVVWMSRRRWGLDIWVREGSSTWSKKWVVVDTHPVIRGWDLQFVEPAAVSGDGRILIMTCKLMTSSGINHVLYSYDPKEGKGVVKEPPQCSWSGLIPCNATLVSPNSL